MVAASVLSAVFSVVLFRNPAWDGMSLLGYVSFGLIFGLFVVVIIWSAGEAVFGGWKYTVENRRPPWLPVLVTFGGGVLYLIASCFDWSLLRMVALGMCLFGIGTVLSIIVRWFAEACWLIRRCIQGYANINGGE